MTNKVKRKKRKSFRLGAFLIVFLFLFGAYNFGQEYLQYLDLKGEVNYYQDKLETIEDEYASLQDQKGLFYDDSYLEKMARQNLGMIKDGETLILPMVESNALKLNQNLEDVDIH